MSCLHVFVLIDELVYEDVCDVPTTFRPSIGWLVETPQSSIATQYYDPTSVLCPCIRKMSTVVSAVSPVSPVFLYSRPTPRRHATPRHAPAACWKFGWDLFALLMNLMPRVVEEQTEEGWEVTVPENVPTNRLSRSKEW
jgi:hypothetical protein